MEAVSGSGFVSSDSAQSRSQRSSPSQITSRTDGGRALEGDDTTDVHRLPVTVEMFRGRAQEFHSRDVPDEPVVRLWWFEPTADALVLGSTQRRTIVDVDACRARGVDIVERRSGGGLVLLSEEGTLWLDVVVPVEHRLWERDVTRSAEWLGEVWIAALTAVGVRSLEQHRGNLVRTPASDLICFAGRGPGEVFDGLGSKVVGISQRRTRLHARFQCAVSLHWDPQRLIELVDVASRGGVTVADVARAGSTLNVDRQQLIESMTTLLIERLA